MYYLSIEYRQNFSVLCNNIVAPWRLHLLFRRNRSAPDRGKNPYKRGEKFNEVKRRTTFICNRVVLSLEFLLFELVALK